MVFEDNRESPDRLYRSGDFFFNSGPQTNSNCVDCVDRVLGVLFVHLRDYFWPPCYLFVCNPLLW